MRVSNPYKSVSLYAVPQHILHIEMHGICGGVVYSVQQTVATLKASLVFKLSVNKSSQNAFEIQNGASVKQLYANITEARLSKLLIGKLGDISLKVSHCVIVAGKF